MAAGKMDDSFYRAVLPDTLHPIVEVPRMTPEQKNFLVKLMRWDGCASPRDLGPQTSQTENSARQSCKRRGWAFYQEGYWRITDYGRDVLSRKFG
jgi:hypothetical protein